MVRYQASLDQEHVRFITQQSLFFVASAPWAGDHINVSPKGHPSRTFSVLSPTRIAYLDATGSSCETISHVYENGRVTVMFCSFGSKPQTLRMFCTGKVVEKWDPYYQQLRAKMATENGDAVDIAGARAIIVLKINKVQTSCGFAIPCSGDGMSTSSSGATDAIVYTDHESIPLSVHESRPKQTLDEWACKQVEKRELSVFQQRMNHRSLDGLPGTVFARRLHDESFVIEDAKAWLRKVNRQRDAIFFGFVLGLIFLVFSHMVGFLCVKPVIIETILSYQIRKSGMNGVQFVGKTEL